jgi:hypothetical protein
MRIKLAPILLGALRNLLFLKQLERVEGIEPSP